MVSPRSTALKPVLETILNSVTDKKALEFSAGEFPLTAFYAESIPFLSVCNPLPKGAVPAGTDVIPYAEMGEDCYFGRFNLVFAPFTVSGMGDPAGVMMKLRRLIVKGGRFLIAEMDTPAITEKTKKALKLCGFTDAEEIIRDGIRLFLCTK